MKHTLNSRHTVATVGSDRLKLPRFRVGGAALLSFFGGLFIVASANAGLSTEWTFTSGSVGSADVIGSQFSAATMAVAGSGVTKTITSGSGLDSSPSDGNFLSLGGGKNLNNGTITITLTANGAISLSAMTLDFDYARSGGDSPKTITWAYVVSGGGGSGSLGTSINWTGGNAGTPWTVNPAISLSSIGAVASGATITFTGTLSGAYTGNSTSVLGIDDVDFSPVTPVPEPANYALAGFGLIFVGGSAGRFYLGRRKQAICRA